MDFRLCIKLGNADEVQMHYPGLNHDVECAAQGGISERLVWINWCRKADSACLSLQSGSFGSMGGKMRIFT